jgi:hypothetical protein
MTSRKPTSELIYAFRDSPTRWLRAVLDEQAALLDLREDRSRASLTSSHADPRSHSR